MCDGGDDAADFGVAGLAGFVHIGFEAGVAQDEVDFPLGAVTDEIIELVVGIGAEVVILQLREVGDVFE